MGGLHSSKLAEIFPQQGIDGSPLLQSSAPGALQNFFRHCDGEIGHDLAPIPVLHGVSVARENGGLKPRKQGLQESLFGIC